MSGTELLDIGRACAAIMGVFGTFVALCWLNDVWLQKCLTPEQYDAMVDSYDDWL